MKRILISGYYGFDNAGDEAVLAGLVYGLQQSANTADVSLTALSIAPGSTAALHGIAARERYKQLLPAIANCDLLLSGGGSLLQDVTSAHGIFYYLAVVRIAQILGRKSMFVAQGIGPLIHTRSRKLTASVANRLDAITVRDSDSLDLLQSIGVTRSIEVTADPALLLTTTHKTSRNGVLLSLRQWPSLPLSFPNDLATSLSSTSMPGPFEALNMHGASDAAAAAGVIGLLGDKVRESADKTVKHDFRNLLQRVASAELVVGMRLHALIFAAAAGVPAVALSYDPKVQAFMESIGQSDGVVDLAHVTPSDLGDTVAKVWASRDVRAEQLKARLPELRKRAMKNSEAALSLLN